MTHPFEWLAKRLVESPDRTRLTYRGDDNVWSSLDGHGLLASSRRLSADIQQQTAPGDRVLLAYPPGLEFAVGFLACVHAGVIPVPVQPPKPRRSDSRYGIVANDADARLALTNLALADALHDSVRESSRWIGVANNVETVQASDGPLVGPRHNERSDELLFLQYTSGSTRSPKGVMVSTGNLRANLSVIAEGFQVDRLPAERRIVCGWLPMYHDMGLVGILMAALVHDGHAVTMAPNQFLQQPECWLDAISRFRATMTVAPTFGYHWAASRIREADAVGWDLASLEVAGCGAEPISADVLDHFADRFEASGFRRSTFYPCYGLAESTLMVTGNDRGSDAETPQAPRRRETRSSSNGQATKTHVSSGVAFAPTLLRIVDPESRRPIKDGQVGEIWTCSPSVAIGYWNNPEDTKTAFAARIDGDSTGTCYLRTGDLGFVEDNQLYVTGRLKEIIIIGGANHYPQDIEQTIASSIGAQVDGLPCVAVAVALEDQETEGIAVVQELPRHFPHDNCDALIRDVRLAIASTHDLATAAVHLVRVASLPRTSSGKLQRTETGRRLLSGKLVDVHSWKQPTGYDESVFRAIPSRLRAADQNDRLAAFMETCLLDYLRQSISVSVDLSADTPLADCGLDSLRAVELARQLENWLGLRLSPVLAWSHPNARRLSVHLSGLVGDVGDQENIAVASDELALAGDMTSEQLEQFVAELEGMDDDDADQMLRDMHAE